MISYLNHSVGRKQNTISDELPVSPLANWVVLCDTNIALILKLIKSETET